MKKNWAYKNNVRTLPDYRRYQVERAFKIVSGVVKTIGTSFKKLVSDIQEMMNNE